MTQPYQQPPYQPQEYAYPAAVDPRASVKRASILMFVLAILMLLLAGCAGAFSVMPFEQLPDETRQEFDRLEQQLRDASGMGLRESARAAAIAILIPAVLLIITGIGVRTGKRPWIVAAMIVSGLLTVILTLQTISGLMQLSTNASAGICSMVMFILPLALFVLVLRWLWNGYRIAGAPGNVGTSWSAQPSAYWQYPQKQPPYPAQQTQQPQPPPASSSYGYAVPPQQPPAEPSAPSPAEEENRPPGL